MGEEANVSSNQQKSHPHNEIFVCSTGLVPHDDNIASGGSSFLLACERVGHYAPARRTTHRRQNNDNCLYKYPQIDQKPLR